MRLRAFTLSGRPMRNTHLPHGPSSRQPRPVRGAGYPCLPCVVACCRTRTGSAPAETSAEGRWAYTGKSGCRHSSALPPRRGKPCWPTVTPSACLHASQSRRGVGVTASSRRRRGKGCPAFASWPEGWPRSCGPLGGGQLRGGICVSFPDVCRVLASGLRWRFRIFPPPAAQGGSVGIRPPSVACSGPGQPAMAGAGARGHQNRNDRPAGIRRPRPKKPVFYM